MMRKPDLIQQGAFSAMRPTPTYRDGFALTILILLVLFLPQSAQAYIDPGNGSMIIQWVIAGGLTVLYAAKVYWQQLKHAVTHLLSRVKK
jgi:hypothetical protein